MKSVEVFLISFIVVVMVSSSFVFSKLIVPTDEQKSEKMIIWPSLPLPLPRKNLTESETGNDSTNEQPSTTATPLNPATVQTESSGGPDYYDVAEAADERRQREGIKNGDSVVDPFSTFDAALRSNEQLLPQSRTTPGQFQKPTTSATVAESSNSNTSPPAEIIDRLIPPPLEVLQPDGDRFLRFKLTDLRRQHQESSNEQLARELREKIAARKKAMIARKKYFVTVDRPRQQNNA